MPEQPADQHDTADWTPTRKVTAATLGSAIAGIIAWAATQWGGVEVPLNVGLSISTIATAVCGYMVKEI